MPPYVVFGMWCLTLMVFCWSAVMLVGVLHQIADVLTRIAMMSQKRNNLLSTFDDDDDDFWKRRN